MSPEVSGTDGRIQTLDSRDSAALPLANSISLCVLQIPQHVWEVCLNVPNFLLVNKKTAIDYSLDEIENLSQSF